MPRNRPDGITDVIVVLGARLNKDGQPSRALLRRIRHGLNLFVTGQARFLILSGGVTRPGVASEAAVMRDLACGVAADRIVLEQKSKNTFDNARFTAEIMVAEGWESAIIVTDCYHLPRALKAFRKAGVVNVIGSAAFGALRDLTLLGWLLCWVREIVAMVKYEIMYSQQT